MTIYCLSGLGVDARAFDKISIPGVQLIHVDWIPAEKNERLENYAHRLFESIQPPKDYVLMGVSFGGMIAQEWSKIQPPTHLILVSTTSTSRDVNPLLRIPGKLGMYRLLHPKIATTFSFVTNWLFGVNTQEDKRMLKEILKDTDPDFLRWATGALLHWKCTDEQHSVQIHGRKDRIIGNSKNANLFTDGGHFTIYSEGAEISVYLSKLFG